MKTQLITKHNQINKTTFNVNKYEKQTSTTQLKDSIKCHRQGPRLETENKHNSPDKIGRLQLIRHFLA